MSVLDRFVRIRGYRERAAAYCRLATRPYPFVVQQRYLAIADHYTALADGELVADRLARQRRLQDMADERMADQRMAAGAPPSPAEPPKLRVIVGGAQIGSRATPDIAARRRRVRQ